MTESELLDQFLAYLAGEALAELTPALAALIGETVTGMTREESLRMSQEQAAELVKNITDGMRDQMRDIITEALRNQDGIESLKRALREGLPLDGPRAERLDKYAQELIDQGLKPGSPEYEAALEKRRQELINERARTIARTETAKALETGEQEVAVNRGATHKVWLTVSDGRVSDFCAACEAQGPIPIDEDFVGDGSFDPTPTAPGHPNCRCTVTYITDTGRGELGRQARILEEKTARTQKAREADEGGE